MALIENLGCVRDDLRVINEFGQRYWALVS
jgi:hypothetical protein